MKTHARIWDIAQMRASKNRKNKQTTSTADWSNGQQIATDADTEGFTQMEGNLAAYATSDKANAN